MLVGSSTPVDVYSLTFRTGGKDGSKWTQSEEFLLNVLAGNNAVIGASLSSINLGRMLNTNMKTQSVTVTRNSGTSSTSFSATASNGATATGLTNNGPGAVTGTQNGSFTAGIANTLGANTLGKIVLQNTGNDGFGVSSDGAGLGSAQNAINIGVTGTVIERRTFAAPGTVNLGNILKGAAPSVNITSNNANPDSNHATSVNVNGVLINSGTPTKVSFPSTFNNSGTDLTGSVNLPVVTAEAASVGDTVPYSDIVVPYTINVGNATAASGLSQPGTYGPAFSGSIGSQFSVLSSQVVGNSGTGGALGSEAQILDVGAGLAGSVAQMQWRTRAANEQLPGVTHPPVPNNSTQLISDVVDLSGLNSAFVLQMSFDNTLAGGSQTAKHLAFINDALFLASKNPTNGYFENAVARNIGIGSDAVAKFEGSWADFTSTGPVAGKSIDSLVGSWGADTAGTTVWAVVNHNSEFAAVPEPSTVVMLVMAGLVALLFNRKSN